MTRPSLELVTEMTAEEFSAPMHAMFRADNQFLAARWAAVHIAIECCGKSLKDVATFFGHPVHRICGLAGLAETEASENTTFREHLASIRERIGPLEPLTPEPKMEDAREAVMMHFGLSAMALIGPSRALKVVRPRQIAMREARLLTGRSLPDIGLYFGRRDHTTVINSIRRIDTLRASNPQIAQDVETVHELAVARLIERRQRMLASFRQRMEESTASDQQPA